MIIFKPLVQWMQSESGVAQGETVNDLHTETIFWVHLGFWTFSEAESLCDCLPFHFVQVLRQCRGN